MHYNCSVIIIIIINVIKHLLSIQVSIDTATSSVCRTRRRICYLCPGQVKMAVFTKVKVSQSTDSIFSVLSIAQLRANFQLTCIYNCSVIIIIIINVIKHLLSIQVSIDTATSSVCRTRRRICYLCPGQVKMAVFTKVKVSQSTDSIFSVLSIAQLRANFQLTCI